jgi:PEP-CTERM motif-containing protein
MERLIRSVFVLLTVAGLSTATERRAGASTLLTFENTNTTNEQPLTNYGGLLWQNVQTMNTDWWVSTGNPINGYVNGAVSPPTVAWVPADGNSSTATATISSTTPFAFDSAALTSAWNDKLLLQVTGYLNGQIVGSQSVTLNPSAPTMVNFNFPQVDTVRLSASGGTYDPAFPSPAGVPPASIPPSPQFVIDNVTIDQPTVSPEPPPVLPPVQSPVPEPSSLAVAGLLIAGWWFGQKRARDRS